MTTSSPVAESDRLKVGIAGFGIVGNIRREFVDSHPRMQVAAKVIEARFPNVKIVGAVDARKNTSISEDVNEACKTSVYDLTMHLNPLLPRRIV